MSAQKFKVGDRVFLKDSKVVHTITSIKEYDRSGTFYRLDDENSGWYEEYLTLVEKTMDNLQKGDVVTGGYGSEYTVGARLEDIVFLLDSDGDSAKYYTIDEMKKDGYKLKTDEVKELTVAEIAEELGYQVKVVEG